MNQTEKLKENNDTFLSSMLPIQTYSENRLPKDTNNIYSLNKQRNVETPI